MRDIVENGQAILQYTRGMDFEAYLQSSITRDASERCLARLSEASIKLGPTAEELFPAHDWRNIRGVGNVLRHGYEDILDEVVWMIVTDRLPPLLVELNTFLGQYPDDQETL
ncbi:DUF86 domain-containing protein [Rhizobium deserti]|uniref:DUF86 domain-containing protein n=1 Tax=Rhizobium deserti TaxID=2547961 RepID=A0A4R5UL67_9HYPH|nr:DUF86 domain-containing protein [Rhizobium deserti]